MPHCHPLLYPLALFAAVLLACPAHARVYQWQDPQTGSTYLSGMPPAWYRSAGVSGPRVQVYDDGRLVDDTNWQTSAEEASALRDRALSEAEARREAMRRAAMAQEEAEKASEEVPAASDDEIISLFRSIVEQWDQRRGEAGSQGPAEPVPESPPPAPAASGEGRRLWRY